MRHVHTFKIYTHVCQTIDSFRSSYAQTISNKGVRQTTSKPSIPWIHDAVRSFILYCYETSRDLQTWTIETLYKNSNREINSWALSNLFKYKITLHLNFDNLFIKKEYKTPIVWMKDSSRAVWLYDTMSDN